MAGCVLLPSDLLPVSVFSDDRVRTRHVTQSLSKFDFAQEEPVAKKLAFSDEKPLRRNSTCCVISSLGRDMLGAVMLKACRNDKTAICCERVSSEWLFASRHVDVRGHLRDVVLGMGMQPPLYPVTINAEELMLLNKCVPCITLLHALHHAPIDCIQHHSTARFSSLVPSGSATITSRCSSRS